MFMKPCVCLCCVVASRVWFHRAGGPRSSGIGFFCFVSARAWKQKKPTPLDRDPPLHVNRPLGSFYTCCDAYGHVILPGTIMTKHHFLLPTPKIRARSPRWLTGVKTRIIRYLLGPTYKYAFLIRSQLKNKEQKRRKKKETDNKKNN